MSSTENDFWLLEANVDSKQMSDGGDLFLDSRCRSLPSVFSYSERLMRIKGDRRWRKVRQHQQGDVQNRGVIF